ncbi:MAG TPA: hypothetical protein VJ206_04995 [bacterium]|nr:hypothetical protein [bacterium]
MRIRSLSLVVVVLAVVATASTAAPAAGTISGTVTNHTGIPRPLAGHPVRLTAYVNGAEQDWKETVSDARGGFSFTAPVDPQRTYVAWLHYKDGEYTSSPVIIKTAGQRASVTLRVWEPTSDAGVLRVNVHHVIVEPGEGAVQVAELLVVVNSSDRTYVGADSTGNRRQSLRFSLPDGARDIQLMDGLYERAVTVGADAVIDSVGVKPGMREIAYSYTVPITGRTMALGRRIDYPTGRLEVFGRAGAPLTVTALARQDDVKTDQGTYARYSGGPVETGTIVKVGLTSLPVRRPTARYAAIAVFVGLVAAAVVYPFLRLSRPPGESRRSRQSRDELIQAVAALDDRFDAGEVPEAEYRRRRARYLERLRAMAG